MFKNPSIYLSLSLSVLSNFFSFPTCPTWPFDTDSSKLTSELPSGNQLIKRLIYQRPTGGGNRFFSFYLIQNSVKGFPDCFILLRDTSWLHSVHWDGIRRPVTTFLGRLFLWHVVQMAKSRRVQFGTCFLWNGLSWLLFPGSHCRSMMSGFSQKELDLLFCGAAWALKERMISCHKFVPSSTNSHLCMKETTPSKYLQCNFNFCSDFICWGSFVAECEKIFWQFRRFVPCRSLLPKEVS